MTRLKHCGEITIALGSELLCDDFQITLGWWFNKACGLFMFQTQSDTSPCMTTNTFAISRGTQKGEMWLGDRTGEIEIRMVRGLSSITLVSCCFFALSSLWVCPQLLGWVLLHSFWFVSDACGFLYCRVVALSMSPVDDTFISGSLDKTIRLWDLRSPNCQVGYKIHVHNVSNFQLEG